MHIVWLPVIASGCVSGPQPPPAPAPLAQTPQIVRRDPVPIGLAPLPPGARQRPPLSSPDVRLVNYDAQDGLPPRTEPETLPATPLQPASINPLTPPFPIDLPTALRLADADNLQVALAREQIQQAYAEYRQANYLWLPALRGGMHWNKHEGPLLDTAGNVLNISRGSLYAGAGAFAVGAGSPAIPGLFANFNIADAIFQPLAAQQRWGARESAATAQRNNTLLDVSLGYMELLRAAQDVAIAIDLRDKMAELSRITDAYAKTGQGLQADADRMRVELGLRDIDIRRSQESLAVASARLTQLLRLEPCVRLEPVEPHVVQLCLVSKDCQCQELVAQALSNRPELRQNRYLVGEAVQRLRRERFAPLVPSVLLGASYGGFGGGPGGVIANFDNRFDFDAVAFWELRSLGFGESAARDGAGSRLRQAQLQELSVLDLVARETTETLAQVQLRDQQVGTARDVVRFAVQSYDHNLTRIRAGQGLPIEVLQSIQALLQARREYLRAVIDYNSAQFSLQRALGWPVGQPELVQPPQALPPQPQPMPQP